MLDRTDKSAQLLAHARYVRERQRDEQIVRLEQDLAKEKDARLKERFMWLIGLIVLFDFYVFAKVSSFESFLLFVFELLLLIPLARELEIKEVITLLDRLTSSFSRKNTGT